MKHFSHEEPMMRSKPVARAIRLLSLIEKKFNGLRAMDMSQQLAARPGGRRGHLDE